MHEINRPRHVDSFRGIQGVRLVAFYPALRFDSQVQLQLAVDAFNVLVVERQTLNIVQIRKAQPGTPFPVDTGMPR